MTAAEFDVRAFTSRVVRDAMNEATSVYWMSRAKQFESACPRLGDFLARRRRRRSPHS